MKGPKQEEILFIKHDLISQNILILFGLIVILVILAISIWAIAPYTTTPDAVGQVLVHARSGKPYNISPEPVERAIYIILAAVAPTALSGYFWYHSLKNSNLKLKQLHKKVRITLPLFAALLFAALFWGADFIDILLFPSPWAKEHKITLTITAALLSTALIYHCLTDKVSKGTAGKIIWWTVALLAIALQVLSYRVVSINSVTLSPIWSVHLDAVTYALNQVIHGKTLIADLPSQYGLFPEIIAPLFKLTGFSIFKETLFFAILHALGLVIVATLLHRHIANKSLSIFIFLALSVATCLFMYTNGIIQDIYIQYFPIRFFWPASALLLISIYSKNENHALLCVLGITSGIAILWNFDTGIPVLISIGATLLIKPLITKRPFMQAIGRLLLFTVVATLTIALFFSLLRIKAGKPLEFSELLAYQKIFYMTGFGMLPMPLSLHPWQAILVIYAASAVTALSGWQQQDNKKGTYDLLFCSAIMGLGLFAYYQGRSHVFCLILVTWPAILISGILTDLILRSVRRRSTPLASIALVMPFILFFSLGGLVFISTSQNMLDDTLKNFSNRNTPKDSVVADELQFMRSTYYNRHCLILSQRQAIYSAELGIASPVNGPGIAETLLQTDLDNLVKSALSQPLQCIYLGITEGSITFIDVNDALLIEKYPVITKNTLGTMMLLEPASKEMSRPTPNSAL
ncbi:hypothetical protein HX871_29125 [Pseudomonas reactans]|uniref:Glycosyltransferase RgtA/B/C/D-like domain-containing protein n=1 Tax=Pseudomonas reactans TaxID=117680 RepID=A0ABX2R3Z0_9PSED|nr:hypothetical protein [Pseudomonas reactans]NWA44828.1 hypothetical protein [Pseudomonas reactans]NWD98488.1 hypothetical protein [Pseudomonas reactans]